MIKKITSSFLSVLLVALLMPTNIVWAATQVADDVVVDNLKYTLYSEGTTYTATLKGYNGGKPTGELTIPSQIV